ncbi:hypothetical protein HBB16_20550 [Pseudonocardia sp. MCCB 268]|nr:hypothetical protein [Pseudonocardia cytotoxica]
MLLKGGGGRPARVPPGRRELRPRAEGESGDDGKIPDEQIATVLRPFVRATWPVLDGLRASPTCLGSAGP